MYSLENKEALHYVIEVRLNMVEGDDGAPKQRLPLFHYGKFVTDVTANLEWVGVILSKNRHVYN